VPAQEADADPITHRPAGHPIADGADPANGLVSRHNAGLRSFPSLPTDPAGPGRSEADRMPDEDDVDAARLLLVDLEDLPDRTVLPVGGLCAGVLKFRLCW
jgi:hypothetical protein